MWQNGSFEKQLRIIERYYLGCDFDISYIYDLGMPLWNVKCDFTDRGKKKHSERVFPF